MRKKLWLLALVGMVLLNTPEAWGDGDFYVVAGGGGVGTKISSVPYTITAKGFYYLSGNLTYSGSSGEAITVSANDVTLDLMGFSLTKGGTQVSGVGIWITQQTNVEIRNGTVRGFLWGVVDDYIDGKQHRIINIRLDGNANGITMSGSNHLIKGCTSTNNQYYGILLGSGIIADCVASNNARGIIIYGPGSVLGNTAINNTNRNFEFGSGGPTAIMVDRNSAYGLSTNYYGIPGTTGVQWGINAGSP